jgi:hypothetical protein
MGCSSLFAVHEDGADKMSQTPKVKAESSQITTAPARLNAQSAPRLRFAHRILPDPQG